MGTKKATFLGASSLSGFERIIADLFLSAATPSERVKKVEEAFLFAVKTFNEEAAIKLLELLEEPYNSMKETDWKEWTWEKIRAAFSDRLRELYWELPDARQDGTRYSELERKDIPVYESALVKTKLWIVKEVFRDWSREINFKSWKAFRFLVAAYEPDSKEHPKRKDESEDETRARGRRVSKEEQEGILKIVRENIGDYFKPENLTSWLQQPCIPFAIQKVLILARARNGGMDLIKRELRNNELVEMLLQPLKPETCSKAALILAKTLLAKTLADIAELDQKVATLLPRISYVWTTPRTDGGQDGHSTKIGANYPDLKSVALRITLDESASGKMVREIFEEARDKIKKWEKEHNLKAALRVRRENPELELLYP